MRCNGPLTTHAGRSAAPASGGRTTMPGSEPERDDPRQRWALILGASAGTGAAIARAVARDPGLNVFGIPRGHYVDEAHVLEEEVRAVGRDIILHVADAGHRQ